MTTVPTSLFRLLTLSTFLASATILGCGSGKTTVQGKVTHQGKPVVWGTVILVDASGMYHQGDINLDGSYAVADVPTGTVKIAVTSPDPRGAAKRGGGGKGGNGAPKKGKDGVELEDPREKFLKDQGIEKAAEKPLPPEGSWFPLPAKAIDPTTSGMTGQVEAGKPLDIDIK